jgi:transposase InsO family protein
MGNISEKARQRLSMIEWYYQVRDVAITCRMFKVSRKTFYKWLHRYEGAGKQLSSLEDSSKAPHTRRSTTLSFVQEMRIKKLRSQYIRLGKKKLQVLYRKRYDEYISCNHIQQVIEKYNLYYDPVVAKRIRTKKKHWGAKKLRIHQVNPQDYLTDEKPFFFATDTIVLYLPGGMKRYIVTAIEWEKKIAYARVYKNKSSLSAFDFLLRLNMLVDGKIALVLSDNGSEFAKYFEVACRQLKITHIYTRVKTPKDNSVDERFNRTIQEEFMAVDEYFEPSLANDDLTEANQHLAQWLVFYNFQRPHQTLKYLSPIEWYNTNYQLPEVSPMYPAITCT